jgi:hypothetical protein
MLEAFTRFTKARALYRRDGLGAVAYRAAFLGVQKIGCHLEWFHLYETTAGDHEGEGTLAWAWIEGTPEQIRQLCGLREDPELYRHRFDQGYRCAVTHDGPARHRITAMLWFVDCDSWDEDGVDIPLAMTDIWAVDGVVAHDQRGQRLHSRLFLAALHHLIEDAGVTRVLSSVDVVNASSLRSAERRGARMLDRIFVLRVGRWALVRSRRERRFGRAPITLPVDDHFGAPRTVHST